MEEKITSGLEYLTYKTNNFIKNTILILLLFSLVGLKCNKNSGSYNTCYDNDNALIRMSIGDFYTHKDYFGKIGTNRILPSEISMYEEDFKPFFLGRTANSSGYSWDNGYISAGYVSNPIEIPYVERSGHTKDSVGKQINRTYYLKIKQDIDTIKISYFMNNACEMKNSNLSIYFNDSLYYSNNSDAPTYEQVNVYKK